MNAFFLASIRWALDPCEVDLPLGVYLKGHVLLDVAFSEEQAAAPVAGRFLAALVRAAAAAHQQQRDDKTSE
jgi:hypothetical protein